MRYIGVSSNGVRMPIISKGDDLVSIVVENMLKASEAEGREIQKTDIIGITEAVVAKAEGNFASANDIAEDVRNKFSGGEVGVVFPILSRNRFMNILKGIAMGASKTYVLLNMPFDEVGNAIMDEDSMDEIETALNTELSKGPIKFKRFREITGDYSHKFTGIDYGKLYESLNGNIEVYISNDPRHIAKLTKNILVAEIHRRFKTKKRLEKLSLNENLGLTVYTLSDILSTPTAAHGYNERYGVLGSNLSTDTALKLFPREPELFISRLKERFTQKLGFSPELLVYGDGAFKDPICGIWELADPVVSPAHTERLSGTPNEIKIKYIADNIAAGEDKEEKIKEIISEKNKTAENRFNDGTTPRIYSDLVGSLCDLTSGSGDKGTPVIWVRGYFDDYAAQ